VIASADRTPICFLLGPSYHGISSLSAKLNQHQDILSLGTGNPLRSEDQSCSCGKSVSECPFWTEIATKIEKAEDDPFETLLPQAPYLASSKGLNTGLNGALAIIANEVGPKAWKSVYEQAERFLKVQETFLATALELAPHKAYADAERSNLKFMIMASMGFPVKGAVHMIRDPRGYVAAWKKYYPESTAEKLTLEWAAAHTRINRMKQFFSKVPFLTVRYEDWASAPDETMRRITDFMRIKDSGEGMILSQSPLKNHMIGAMQDQAAEGVSDAENWRETLDREDQERVIRAAGPLFGEFGYKT